MFLPGSHPHAPRAIPRRPFARFALLGLLLVWCSDADAQQPPAARPASPPRLFLAETHAFFLSGEYGGEESTDIWYVPVSLKSLGPRYEFGIVVPFLSIDGPASVSGGDRPSAPTGEEASGGRRSGPGDILLRGEYFFLAGDGRRRPWLSVLGRVKLPTAREDEGLGTGEVDLSAGAAYTQPWGPRVFIYLDAVRKKVGDPEGVEFQDTTSSALQVSVRPSSAVWLYLMYDREDSIVSGFADGESLTAGLLVRVGEGWRLSAALLRGLSDTREDFGAVIGLGRSWEVSGSTRTGG